MKKLLFILTLAVILASCSKDKKTTNLLDRIPANTDMVMLCNVKTIVESAGGSLNDGKLEQVPPFLEDMMSDTSDFKEGLSFLRTSGVDADACALVCSASPMYASVVFHLNDTDSFVKALEEMGFEKGDNIGDAIYLHKKVQKGWAEKVHHAAINDDYAYFFPFSDCNFDIIAEVKSTISEAAKSPFGDTPYGEYIAKGNAGGMALNINNIKGDASSIPPTLRELCEGTMCAQLNLTDNELSATYTIMGSDGKPVGAEIAKSLLDTSAKINNKALAYMGTDDVFVSAVSLKDVDWNTTLDLMADMSHLPRSQRAMMYVAKPYLDKIDGTLAMGFGVKGGLMSLQSVSRSKDVLKNISITMVCETKKGEAESLMNDMRSMLGIVNADITDTKNGFSFGIPGESGTLYVERIGDMLILSNHETVKGENATVKTLDFDNYNIAFGGVASTDHPVMRDLNITNNMRVMIGGNTEKGEGEYMLYIDGKGKFIEKMAAMIAGVKF